MVFLDEIVRSSLKDQIMKIAKFRKYKIFVTSSNTYGSQYKVYVDTVYKRNILFITKFNEI